MDHLIFSNRQCGKPMRWPKLLGQDQMLGGLAHASKQADVGHVPRHERWFDEGVRQTELMKEVHVW